MTPADLRKYLESQGWVVFEAGIKDRLYVFEHADFPRRQLAYPMDMTAPDYEESVGGALLKLADITGRKIESLIAEVKMEMTRNDIINKLQDQGLRWIESERDARSESALDAVQDAITTGTGIMRGGERIDPASIYKSAASVQDAFKKSAIRARGET